MVHLSESSQLQQLTAAQLGQEKRRGILILDTRPTEEFASFHIPGSMQIGLMGSLASWAAILIRSSERILLVVENANCAQEAHSRLARVGLENVVDYTVANKQQWQQHGLELTSMPIYRCEDVCHTLRANLSPQLIDVRSWAEWLQGHLPGAISMPLLELSVSGHTVSLTRSQPILVYCQEEYRATIAASMLLRDHVGDIGILNGGVQEWQACSMPLETPRDKRIGSTPTVLGELPDKNL
ncbi:rhodanese-like domain-containing protein [Edaphobacter modestus]|uniref:Rhodanese-related sulfurtransferase n=1 Tax=Edaphobacter modestus TaxID=388466 RepID=A0A4Q7YQQ1_9BACT|nr:rhodanese-like domain-containing protein [Edaphobacter modestus]RZU39149.1 rhodanese-related sulfurtransferase [Edaphobacter modestus]